MIGLPVKTDMMGGLDSLLSIVQMPSGIPVATVGVNGGGERGAFGVADFGNQISRNRGEAGRL